MNPSPTTISAADMVTDTAGSARCSGLMPMTTSSAISCGATASAAPSGTTATTTFIADCSRRSITRIWQRIHPPSWSQAAADAPADRKTGKRQAGTSGQINQMCGDSSNEAAGWPIDRIEQSVSPTAEQRAALNEFADAAIRAARTIKDACPIDVVFTPSARLETMQKRLEGMVQAVSGVAPPLDRFYGLLTDEQKARLDAVNEQYQRDRRATAGCNAAVSATRWAAEQIDKAVQPGPEQQAKLDTLKMAMAAAANDLTDACPSSLPTTPPARLKAISRQLNVLLGAVKHVRTALDDFYASLDDEQKAQFNAIGRQRSAKQ